VHSQFAEAHRLRMGFPVDLVFRYALEHALGGLRFMFNLGQKGVCQRHRGSSCGYEKYLLARMILRQRRRELPNRFVQFAHHLGEGFEREGLRTIGQRALRARVNLDN